MASPVRSMPAMSEPTEVGRSLIATSPGHRVGDASPPCGRVVLESGDDAVVVGGGAVLAQLRGALGVLDVHLDADDRVQLGGDVVIRHVGDVPGFGPLAFVALGQVGHQGAQPFRVAMDEHRSR